MALPKARWASSSASCAWSSSMRPGCFGTSYRSLPSETHEGDRAAVEHPGAGRRVGAEHATLGHGLGVRRVADLDVEAGGLELLLGGLLRHAEHAGGRGVARPAEPPGADARRPRRAQGEQQEQTGPARPARPADRGDPGDAGRAAARGGGRARWCGAPRRSPRRAPPTSVDIRGELVDVERVRRGVLDASRPEPRRAAAARSRVSSSSSRTPSRSAWADPVDLVQQHPGVGRSLVAVAGGRPGDQRVDVRRQAGHGSRRRRDVLVHVLVGHLRSGTRPRAAWCR